MRKKRKTLWKNFLSFIEWDKSTTKFWVKEINSFLLFTYSLAFFPYLESISLIFKFFSKICSLVPKFFYFIIIRYPIDTLKHKWTYSELMELILFIYLILLLTFPMSW